MKNEKLKMNGCARRIGMRKRRGQAVLLVILVLGGTLIGATAIAGFLTNIQLRQVGDVADSAKAVFATDAGVNCGHYMFEHRLDNPPPLCFDSCDNTTKVCTINLANKSRAEVTCFKDEKFEDDNSRVLCNDSSAIYISSKGISGVVQRAFLFTITAPSAGP